MATPPRRAVSVRPSQPRRRIKADGTETATAVESPYHLRISRLTVDKLGVKLYDKASAVVAELIANGYDADAEAVTVRLPLSIQLASKAGDALTKFGHTHVREMIGEAVPPAFTRMHGQVLYGIVKREWERAPMTLSDERCVKAWTKLATAAKKDDRVDPRSYFEHAMPNGHGAASTKPIRASGATTKSTRGQEASQQVF